MLNVISQAVEFYRSFAAIPFALSVYVGSCRKATEGGIATKLQEFIILKLFIPPPSAFGTSLRKRREGSYNNNNIQKKIQ